MPTTPATKLARPTWREILDWNEHFDGETAIAAQAKRAWRTGRYDLPAAELAARRARGY